MQRLAREVTRHRIDSWLKDVVAGVLESSPTIKIDRTELWDLLDNLPVAVLISTDQTCTRIVGNKAAQGLLRVPLGNNLSRSAPDEELPSFKVYADGHEVDPDDLPMQRAARTGMRVNRSECEIRFEAGNSIFIAGHCIPIQNERGEVCGSLGAFVDVTEQRSELEKSDLLAREMTHRVKNTVSLIQSLAHSTIRQSLDPDEYSTFESRLIGLSRAQDLLGAGVAGADLADLISGAIRPIVHVLLTRVSIKGPAVTVPSHTALSLSMIFHELATNACKYGSLSSDAGSVSVTWELDVQETQIGVSLNWLELGGPEVRPPERFGFGSKLIDRLARSLPRGRLSTTYRPAGLQLNLVFTLVAGPIA